MRKMKTNRTILLLLSILIHAVFTNGFAAENGYTSYGVTLMAGYRYDNLRLCVASGPGVKGGPIGDIMVNFRKHFDEKNAFGFKLPLMRPIIFGAAFKMLQFEPEFIFEHSTKVNDRYNFVIGPGLGVSLNYGPDYKTGWKSANRVDFFSAGPFISSLFAVNFKSTSNLNRIIGIRVFYIPLFTKDHGNGTVAGAAFETHFDLYNN
jgi:hypothetical protein